jgi:hypothetical protein
MARARRRPLKPIVVQGLGYSFLVLGVLGMFLPILQGFLFLFIGLIILARHAPWAQRLLDRIRHQHPKFDHLIGQAEAKAHDWGVRASATFRAWRVRSRVQLRRWSRWWFAAPRPATAPCRPGDPPITPAAPQVAAERSEP